MPEPVIDRRVVLATAANMRDLGGLPVAGGVFAKGKVFRSASLADLSDADGQVFADLGIAHVYDLRTEEERSAQPDRLPAFSTQVVLDVLADGSMSVAATIGKLRTAPESMNELLGAGTIQKMLVESYRDFIRLPSATASYRALFVQLADAGRPGAALFHCTAGKDRTGWAAASLLMLLGASDDTIHTDYLQTNEDLLPTLEPLILSAASRGVDPDLMRDAFGVRVSYLEATLDQLETQYGSVEAYFSDGLGLTTQTIDALRERLVSAPTPER